MLFKITYSSILAIEITPCISLCFLTLLYIIIVKVDEKLNMSLSLGYHHTSINWRRLILKTSLAHVILTRQQLKQYNGYSAYFGLKKETSSYCGVLLGWTMHSLWIGFPFSWIYEESRFEPKFHIKFGDGWSKFKFAVSK